MLRNGVNIMGYLLFESEESTFKTGIKQLHDAIREAGKDQDGVTNIEITIRGKSEKRISLAIAQHDELLDILQLNSD